MGTVHQLIRRQGIEGTRQSTVGAPAIERLCVEAAYEVLADEQGRIFEASCYTDPLGIEHITGSLAETMRFFGGWEAEAQLRFTTKYDAVGPLLDLPHKRRTRIRFSVNARGTAHLEGGAPRVTSRLQARRQAAMAGYRIGLTVAPILHLPNWREAYDAC